MSGRYEWLSQIVCCVAAYCDDSCAATVLSKVLQETAESAQVRPLTDDTLVV